VGQFLVYTFYSLSSTSAIIFSCYLFPNSSWMLNYQNKSNLREHKLTLQIDADLPNMFFFITMVISVPSIYIIIILLLIQRCNH